jgi:hypothetical protein
LNNNTLDGDYYEVDNSYYKSSGLFDGSVDIDENDANIWFNITTSEPSKGAMLSDYKEYFENNFVKLIYPSDDPDKPLVLGPAMLSDWTSSGMIFSKLSNVTEGVDTNPSYVNQVTGMPVGEEDNGFMTFGGPDVNLMTYYAENYDNAPIHFVLDGDRFYFRLADDTGIPGADLPISVINFDEDMFVIEIFEDNYNRYQMIFQGFGWKGTYAAGKYFDRIIYPALEWYDYDWIIVKWDDGNNDGFVNAPGDGDIYTVISTG